MDDVMITSSIDQRKQCFFFIGKNTRLILSCRHVPRLTPPMLSNRDKVSHACCYIANASTVYYSTPRSQIILAWKYFFQARLAQTDYLLYSNSKPRIF